MWKKISNVFCQTSFNCDDLAALKAPLDIPIPDPAKEEAKRKRKEEVGHRLRFFIFILVSKQFVTTRS